MITGKNHKGIMPVSIILFYSFTVLLKRAISINLNPGRHINKSFTSIAS